MAVEAFVVSWVRVKDNDGSKESPCVKALVADLDECRGLGGGGFFRGLAVGPTRQSTTVTSVPGTEPSRDAIRLKTRSY